MAAGSSLNLELIARKAIQIEGAKVVAQAEKEGRLAAKAIAENAVVLLAHVPYYKVRALARAMERDANEIGSKLQPYFRAAAEAARQAILNSYIERVEGERLVQPYRVGADNRLSGTLKKALESPELFRVSGKGITLNLDFLNAEAKHWARLNFGAGGKAESGFAAGSFEFDFDAAVDATSTPGAGLTALHGSLAPLTLGQFGPRPGFALPPGFWSGEGGGEGGGGGLNSSTQEFYPTRKMRPGAPLTKGIAARQFLDAGLAVLAKEVPVGLTLVANRIQREANERSKPRSRRIDATQGTSQLDEIYPL